MSYRSSEYAALPNEDRYSLAAPSNSSLLTNQDVDEHVEQLDGATDEHVNLNHQLTFTNGLALVIGLQIGSGVFAAPSIVSQHVDSLTMALSAWILGGLLVWTGAASFIELGLSMPRNGGIQEYLRVCYGDFPAFLFSWVWTTVVKPCAVAMIAIVFAENLCRGLVPVALTSDILVKSVGVCGLAVVVLVNCRGAKTGALVGNAFLVLKLFTVFSVGLIGISTLIFPMDIRRNESHNQSSHNLAKGDWSFVGEYVTALFGVLFCYGGWETVGFVAGDMKNPVRDLPRVINIAMITVIFGFAIMVFSLHTVLPMESMRTTSTPIIDFAESIFGSIGRRICSVLASICALGALHANVFTTSRLCVVAAERLYLPRILASKYSESGKIQSETLRRIVPRSILTIFSSIITCFQPGEGVPLYAICFSCLPAVIFLVLGNLGRLVTFYGISEYIFFFLTALGVFRLRAYETSEKAHRTFTANPVIFCSLSAFIVFRGIISDPLQGLAIVAIILAGFVLYKYKFRNIERQ